MAFTKKIPEWNASGVEPPQSLKDSGWKPGVKPAADHFNWLQTTASEAIKELQQKAGEVKKVNGQLPDANGNVNVNIDTSKLATKEELSSASTYIQQEMNDLEQTVAAHQTDLTNLAIGKKITLNVTSDFSGKVSGSTVENPNVSKVGNSLTLQNPISTGFLEPGPTTYDKLKALDNNLATTSTTVINSYAEHIFSFNIIEILQRKYGIEIFGSATTLADKVAKAKTIITNITCNWNGYGSNPSGTKAYLDVWNDKNGTWDGYPISHLYGSVKKLTKTYTTTAYALIDSNGFVHYIVYAEPSDGTVPSIINTDYVSLDITVSVSALVDHQTDDTKHLTNGLLKINNGSTNFLLKMDVDGLYLEEV